MIDFVKDSRMWTTDRILRVGMTLLIVGTMTSHLRATEFSQFFDGTQKDMTSGVTSFGGEESQAIDDFVLNETGVALLGESLSVSDASVGGYIDDAVISSRVRFRYNNYSNTDAPDRAEYLFPFTAAVGGRATLPQGPLDWEEYRVYTEVAYGPVFSVFADFGLRNVQNAFAFDPIAQGFEFRQSGGSDTIVGMKIGLLECENRYLTAQTKVYIPSGDPERCLGTGHTSLEFGLLYNGRYSDRLTIFGEIKDWFSINAYGNALPNNRSSNILSYGAGFGYDLHHGCCWDRDSQLAAVFEVVGWTVLDGFRTVGFGPVNIADSDNDTIVNGKYGLRYNLGRDSFYVGYGNALTNDTWYESVLRIEYSRFF